MNNIKYIADHYGLSPQLEMLVEESSEVIQAVQKVKRNKVGAEENLIEELADLSVVLKQVIYLLDCEKEVARIEREKIERQIFRIREER